MMTNDEYGVPERMLEPYLTQEDEDKLVDLAVEGIPDSGRSVRILPPNPKEQANKAEVKRVLEATLEWGQFVYNPEILRSGNKAELKAYLEALLEGLTLRHITPPSPLFPDNLELTQLTQVVTALAKLLGVQKTDFGDLYSAMKRIENRWSKMRLIAFADDLRDKLLRVPMSPLSVVLHAPAKDTSTRRALEETRKILNGGPIIDPRDNLWNRCFTAVKALKFPTSKYQLTHTLDSYLFLMDLRRQQLEWKLTYGKRIQPALRWVYLLQRSGDFEQLANVYFGDAMSPEETRVLLAIYANRDRRNRSYQKSVKAVRKAKSIKRRKSSKK